MANFWKSRRPIVEVDVGASDDLRVTKRKVTMTNTVALPNGEVATHVAVDYVRPDFLEAYVRDAERRWQLVEVGLTPDAGPGGYDGDTNIPEGLV